LLKGNDRREHLRLSSQELIHINALKIGVKPASSIH